MTIWDTHTTLSPQNYDLALIIPIHMANKNDNLQTNYDVGPYNPYTHDQQK